MTQTNSNTLTSATASSTADAAPTKIARPRRWWRAVDRFTLETMNAPLPARVRATKNSHDTDVNPTTDFAAAIRADAPGRSERTVRSSAHIESGFAAGIRAEAPGRRS